MTKALVIPAEGDIYDTDYADYTVLQKLVGGLIELVVIPFGEDSGLSGYINEEGKLLELDYNPRATSLCHLFPYDFIAGTMVVTGPADAEGNDTDCPQLVIDALKKGLPQWQ